MELNTQSHDDARAGLFPIGHAKQRSVQATVAVAHDDAPLRAAMIIALRLDRHTVDEATSSEDVLAAAGCGGALLRARPEVTPRRRDVIVCDLWLPDTRRRIETMPLMRDLHWHPPVVLIAVRATANQLDEARRSRAAAVFESPFDLDDLRTVVMNLLPTVAG